MLETRSKPGKQILPIDSRSSFQQLTDEELDAFLDELSLFEANEEPPSLPVSLKLKKNPPILWLGILFLFISFALGFGVGWHFKPKEKESPLLSEIYSELQQLREDLKQKEKQIEAPLFDEIIEPFEDLESPLAAAFFEEPSPKGHWDSSSVKDKEMIYSRIH